MGVGADDGVDVNVPAACDGRRTADGEEQQDPLPATVLVCHGVPGPILFL